MAKLAASPAVTGADLTPVARALVRASVARPGSQPMAMLAHAAVGALVDHLTAFTLVAPPLGTASGRVRELIAIAEALHAT
jgi:hypothetical protein